MASEALEQIVEPAFGFGQDNAYQTLDVYTSGLAQMYSGVLEKSQYAKLCKELGFGTREEILVDYGTRETIKIYTDPLKNLISVGYEPFGTPHDLKPVIPLAPVYTPSG